MSVQVFAFYACLELFFYSCQCWLPPSYWLSNNRSPGYIQMFAYWTVRNLTLFLLDWYKHSDAYVSYSVVVLNLGGGLKGQISSFKGESPPTLTCEAVTLNVGQVHSHLCPHSPLAQQCCNLIWPLSYQIRGYCKIFNFWILIDMY